MPLLTAVIVLTGRRSAEVVTVPVARPPLWQRVADEIVAALVDVGEGMRRAALSLRRREKG